jgi:hypothetical protein
MGEKASRDEKGVYVMYLIEIVLISCQRGNKRGLKHKKVNDDSNNGSQSNDNEDIEGVLKKKTTPQYIIELQMIHACNTHAGSYCIVQVSRNHYQLTKQDLSLWALLLVSHSYSFLQIVLLIKM